MTARQPLHDVVWMLATNDIDGLDEAVIRRFPTKIELRFLVLPRPRRWSATGHPSG